VGTFAEYLASLKRLDLAFCSDLPADCQLSVQQYPVQLLNQQLIAKYHVILICWPKDKCNNLLVDIGAQNMNGKKFYLVEKLQQESCCEFRLCLVEDNIVGAK
jgi:hypothetical protein